MSQESSVLSVLVRNFKFNLKVKAILVVLALEL